MAFIVCIVLASLLVIPSTSCVKLADDDLKVYRDRVVEMFQHAYDGYMRHAYPYDELRPLSCDGVNTWGSFSLTLIDALDTLTVMGNYSEFRRVAAMIARKMDFNININVSVFETNIRVVGGLLSAHLLSRHAGAELEPGWPCSGPLLRLAEDVANRLLPAFATKTGMPYGTVNLVSGVPRGETSVTCTAGVGTFLLEFATLSRLTGNPVFERTALRALRALWKARSAIGLVGNHIDVQTGRWTAVDAGIGAGVDSYYEYLVKGAVMLQMPQLVRMFAAYKGAIEKYMRRDDWFFWVSMSSGQVTMPVFQSLEAFWPGLLTLTGDLDGARKSLYNYHQVWRQYGFTPEFYDVVHSQANSKRDGYPLRPELVESVMYLYQATKDPHLLEIGVDILESIAHSARTECGYATIRKVQDHELEDRMESFFLAETTKYLYLLFSPDHFIHNNGSRAATVQTPSGRCVLDAGGYVFNTEAHPIDVAAVHCCSAHKVAEDAALERLEELLDLSKLLVDERREEFVRPLDDHLRDYFEDGASRAEEFVGPRGTGSLDSDGSEASVAQEVGARTVDADMPVAVQHDIKDPNVLTPRDDLGDDLLDCGAHAEDGASTSSGGMACVRAKSADGVEATIANEDDARPADADVPVAAERDLKDLGVLAAGEGSTKIDGSSAAGAKSVGTDTAVVEGGYSEMNEVAGSDTANVATAGKGDTGIVTAVVDAFGTGDGGNVEEVETATIMTGKDKAGEADTGRRDAAGVGTEATDRVSVDCEPNTIEEFASEEPTATPVDDSDVRLEADESKGVMVVADTSERLSRDRPQDGPGDRNKEHVGERPEEVSERPFWQSGFRSGDSPELDERTDGAARPSEAYEGGPDKAAPGSRHASANGEAAEALRYAATKDGDEMDVVKKFNRTRDNEGWRAEVTEVDLNLESDEGELVDGTSEGVDGPSGQVRFEIAGKGRIEELKDLLTSAVEQAAAGLRTGEKEESKIDVKLTAERGTAASSDAAKFADRAGWTALTCPSQPFLSRLAFRGEMFNVD
uniref:alpha-1,2-Mannosidase n=1 Tax=Ixodes ricinus TaxID=34613 RepID=A0A131XSZ1_IXORI